jgi:hypothetical protein
MRVNALVIGDLPAHRDRRGSPASSSPNRPVCTSRVHSTRLSCVGEPLATPSPKGLLLKRAWLQALRGSHRVLARCGGQLEQVAAVWKG